MILLLKIFSIIIFILFMVINIYTWFLLYGTLIGGIFVLLRMMDPFNNSQQPTSDDKDLLKDDVIKFISFLIPIIIFLLFGLYLSYRCNNNKFNILSILTAIAFQPFYILYHLFKNNLCGLF